MYEIAFHPAFWMPLALGILGVAVFLFGNARVKSGIRNAGLGIACLTFAWITAAYFVDTFNETCIKRTDAIIAAVEDGKWSDLTKMLDKNTQLSRLRGGEEISHTAEQYATMAQLKNLVIISHEVQPTPVGVDVTIDTLMEAQQNGSSTWTFSYEKRPDGVLLRQIVPIRLNGHSVEEVERVIGKIR